MTDTTQKRTSRAAVFSAVGQPLQIRNVDLPVPAAGEALVRITCCTICGSDLHTLSGHRHSPMPTVLGHEIIGVLESFAGEPLQDVSGQPLHVGDRVTWSVAASCGTCARCVAGLPQKCQTLFKYGHELFEPGTELSGGLADYCVLKRGTAIVRLSPDADDQLYCPANCATATVAAAVRLAGALHQKRVAVCGAGMLGLTTCAFAAAQGAAEICVCDLNENRRLFAQRFGATKTGPELTTDDFDVVFEMSGSPAAVEAAIQAAGIGGRVLLVGSVSPSPAVAVDPERVVRRLLSIQGVHNYRPDDLLSAVRFLDAHGTSFPFAELVERSFPLTAVDEAFDYAVQERPIRVAVRPRDHDSDA
ncbi:MAG: zinc-binding dehydrogenase [Fuerstiella sp.]